MVPGTKQLLKSTVFLGDMPGRKDASEKSLNTGTELMVETSILTSASKAQLWNAILPSRLLVSGTQLSS